MDFFVGQIFLGRYPEEAADWCNDSEDFHIEEIEPGAHGERQFQIVRNAEPTPQEIKKYLTDAVQFALDSFAQEKGYDGIISACSYANSTDEIFAEEAAYCIALRDQTWRTAYNILAEVEAGARDIPTYEELIAELPIGSADWSDIE